MAEPVQVAVRMADGPEGKVRPAVIRIDRPLDTDDSRDDAWVERAARVYREDAQAIAFALRQSLPGGTLDHLTAELLEQRASLLRVTLGV